MAEIAAVCGCIEMYNEFEHISKTELDSGFR